MVVFLREKSKAFDKFKIFKEKLDNESRLRIKCLRSDKGEEFIYNQFNALYEENGIFRKTSAPKTHSRMD